MFKSIAYGIGASIFSILVSVVGNVIQSALVVRYLPPMEAGIWFLYLSVMVMVLFCDFGLSPTVSREIGLANFKKDKRFRIINLYGTAKKVTTYLSLLTLVLFALFYCLWIKKQLPDFNVVLSAGFFALAVMVRLLCNPALAVIYGLGFIATNKNLASCSNILAIIISCSLLKLGFGLAGLCAGYLMGWITLYCSSLFILHKLIERPRKARFNMIVLKRMAEPCLQWTIAMLGAILILQISNFVIASVMGVQYVTSFAVMRQLCAAIITIAGVIGFALVPAVSHAWGLQQKPLVHDLFAINLKLSTAIALAIAVYCFIFRQEVFGLWLGASYNIAASTFLILLVTTVLEVHHVACAQIAMAAGYVKFAVIAIVSGLINLILSIVLVKEYGLIGAAISIMVSQILTCNWYVVVYSIRYLDFPTKAYLKIVKELLIYGAVVSVLCLAIRKYFFTQHIIINLIAAMTAVIICSGIMLLLGKERDYILSLVKNLRQSE